MLVEVAMNQKNEFHVARWYATGPDFVRVTLEEQLQAATAVWPELAQYKLVKTKRKKFRKG